MEMLTLKLETLQVESFGTEPAERAERGTVRAHEATNHSCVDTYCCPYTRFATCTC
jgi:hypothetical protein